MESERPIEKLLRACALKRRRADLPSELHPATRKLLQGEVLRQFAQARQKPNSAWWSFIAAWPKLAWGGAVTAVLAAILGVLIFALPGHKDDSALLASKELAPMPDAIPANELRPTDAEALAPEAAKDKSLQVAQSRDLRSDLVRPAEPVTPPATLAQSTEVSKAKGELQDKLALEKRLDLAANQPTAPAPAVAPTAGMLGGAAGTGPREPAPAGYGLALRSQTAAPAVSTPAVSREETGFTSRSEIPSLKPQIAQQPSSAANVLFADQGRRQGGSPPQGQVFLRTRTTATRFAPASAPEGAVLVSFRVERTDSGLRIIDADGSVYSGSLQALAATAPASTEAAGSRTTRRLAPSAPTDAATALRDAKNAWSFHVVGTNTTLKQKVDFAGQLWPTTNLASLTNLNATSAATAWSVGSPTNSTTSWLLQNSKIYGKALINGRKQVEVNAAPVKP